MRSSAQQAKARRDCFNAHIKEDANGMYLQCHLCQGRINPSTDKWIAEHAVRRAVGGSDAPENVRPACKHCAAEKDRRDISENARHKRKSDKHHGIKRAAGFRRLSGAKYDWGLGRYVWPDKES